MVLTARWKANLHELLRSTGCTSAALDMIKLYCSEETCFLWLIWNESPIQAFIPPMCFAGFLNQHKFWKPQEPWLTSLETVASSCGKKDNGCLWCFSVPPIKEVQKKGGKLKPLLGIYTTDVRAEISWTMMLCIRFFLGHEATATKTTPHPGPNTGAVKSKKMRSLYIFVSLEGFPKSLLLTLLISSSTLRIPQWTNYTCADVQYEGRNASWRAIQSMQSQHPVFLFRTAIMNICHHPLFNMTNGYPSNT